MGGARVTSLWPGKSTPATAGKKGMGLIERKALGGVTWTARFCANVCWHDTARSHYLLCQFLC
eukprot:3613052-Pleurochrysis_carterae.AAC.1